MRTGRSLRDQGPARGSLRAQGPKRVSPDSSPAPHGCPLGGNDRGLRPPPTPGREQLRSSGHPGTLRTQTHAWRGRDAGTSPRGQGRKLGSAPGWGGRGGGTRATPSRHRPVRTSLSRCRRDPTHSPSLSAAPGSAGVLRVTARRAQARATRTEDTCRRAGQAHTNASRGLRAQTGRPGARPPPALTGQCSRPSDPDWAVLEPRPGPPNRVAQHPRAPDGTIPHEWNRGQASSGCHKRDICLQVEVALIP